MINNLFKYCDGEKMRNKGEGEGGRGRGWGWEVRSEKWELRRGAVILLWVRGGNITHVWRVHKERDEKQPPLSKPEVRKIKRFENGAHKNTLTPRHGDLGGERRGAHYRQFPLILIFFLTYLLSLGFSSFDPNPPLRLLQDIPETSETAEA